MLRALAGYTRSAGISTTSLVGAGGMLPLVIEFIDAAEHVERILPMVKTMIDNRLITTSPVDIRHGGACGHNS